MTAASWYYDQALSFEMVSKILPFRIHESSNLSFLQIGLKILFQEEKKIGFQLGRTNLAFDFIAVHPKL